VVVNANPLDCQKDDDPTFVAHQGLDGLQRLAAQWTTLVESLPGARFMHFPEWYRAYLSSLAPDPARVWFIAAYRDQELVGIFPLEFQSHRVIGLRPRVIGTIDDDQMQLSDFVFAQTAENAHLLYQLTQWLRTQRTIRWDELRLRKVPEDSSIAHAFRGRLPTATVALRHDGSSYFQTSGTYDQATRAMSGTFKRNLRRLARRAEQTAPLRFQPYRRPEDLSKAFDILLDIEASGWKGNAGTASAICCRPAMLAFYRALVRDSVVATHASSMCCGMVSMPSPDNFVCTLVPRSAFLRSASVTPTRILRPATCCSNARFSTPARMPALISSAW
jgi:hypothetical protein